MPFANADQRRAYQREYQRGRQRARYHRYRKAGGCGECGEPSGDFSRCFKCRVRLAKRKRTARQLYSLIAKWRRVDDVWAKRCADQLEAALERPGEAQASTS
jgi:hypothetical protein